MPFDQMQQWLQKEKDLGSPNPNNIVLATATRKGVPHSRIVAIKEIRADSILFFTQRETRKAKELQENPCASMTLWLPLQQREVIIDGKVEPLSQEENERYWQDMPRDRQLIFSVYSPISGKAINSIKELENKNLNFQKRYKDRPIPITDFYCGFKFIPACFYFYTFGNNTFSEVIRYIQSHEDWEKQMLSP